MGGIKGLPSPLTNKDIELEATGHTEGLEMPPSLGKCKEHFVESDRAKFQTPNSAYAPFEGPEMAGKRGAILSYPRLCDTDVHLSPVQSAIL